MNAGDDNAANTPRTYLRRRGRPTRAQARALTKLSTHYRLEPHGGRFDPFVVFGRSAPLGLEIGFGMGQALVEWAMERPDWNLLGIDVYQPGIGSLMLALERDGLTNVRVLEAEAERAVEAHLAPASLDEVRIFFPDPWPKKRHHKRRLLKPAFAALLGQRLRPGGVLWIATDWAEYAQSIVEILEAEPALVRERAPRIESGGEDLVDDAAAGAAAQPETGGSARPPTRFESRGRRLGHAVWDLRYRRKC